MSNRARIWRMIYIIEQLIRIVSMQFALTPAAYVLPREWALAVADIFALFLLILPAPGMDTYWQMRRAYGKGRFESLLLAWGYLARIYRDFVAIKRLSYKRENPFHWKIVERNADDINSLRASGESYIVATGHFAREAIFSMTSPSVTYGHPVQLSLSPPDRIRRLYDLRVRIQFGTWQKCDFAGWGRDAEIVFIGPDPLPFRTLYDRLRKPGNVVFMHVDAPWKKSQTGSFERPFAGLGNRVFATGAAQLARLTRCAVISCVYMLEEDGTYVLEWGTPIRCNGRFAENDVDVMNALIDPLEVAVGERPTQYVLGIGSDRRWNPGSRRWEDMTG
jgi:hypothetical protein